MSIWDLVLVNYAVAKDFVGRVVEKNSSIYTILSRILGLLILSCTAVLVLPFAVFRICLHIILKLIYGELYGGILNSPDTIYEVHKDKNVINVVVIYTGKENIQYRIEQLQKCIQKIYNTSYRFSCNVRSCCGYLYLIKNQVIAEKILQLVDNIGTGFMTKSDLYEYIQKNCAAMTENYMWKVYGFLQPIEWSDKNLENKKQYAVIFSFRHCLSDLPALFGVLRKLIVVDTELDGNNKSSIPYRAPLSLDKAFVYNNPFLRVAGEETLKSPEHTNWFLTTFIEENPKYLEIIKALRRKLNVTFVDVVSAAIFFSIRNLSIKREVRTSFITGGTLERVDNYELEEIIKKTYQFKKLANTSSISAFKIPWGAANKSVREDILSAHHGIGSKYGSLDYLVAYVYGYNVLSHFPIWCTRFLCDSLFKGHFSITNLVGCDMCSYEESNVDDLFFCVPTFNGIGFQFHVLTYDRRFGIALGSGKGYVHDRKELQTILDDVIKFLDRAQEEIL